MLELDCSTKISLYLDRIRGYFPASNTLSRYMRLTVSHC